MESLPCSFRPGAEQPTTSGCLELRGQPLKLEADWLISLAPSAPSRGLCWQVESGSEEHLEGPVSGLPEFKGTPRVPGSHPFGEGAS